VNRREAPIDAVAEAPAWQGSGSLAEELMRALRPASRRPRSEEALSEADRLSRGGAGAHPSGQDDRRRDGDDHEDRCQDGPADLVER
jgi:hypothetical protein